MNLQTLKHTIVYFVILTIIIGLTSTFIATNFIDGAMKVGLKGQDISKMQVMLNGATIVDGNLEFTSDSKEDHKKKEEQNEKKEELPIKEFQKGDTGEDLRTYQEVLHTLGFLKSKPDGMFGSMTNTAVLDFQKENDLTETGKLDKETIMELNTYLEETPEKKENPEKTNDKKIHIVKSGESLSVISDTYRVSVKEILQENNLTENALIDVGQEIIIP